MVGHLRLRPQGRVPGHRRVREPLLRAPRGSRRVPRGPGVRALAGGGGQGADHPRYLCEQEGGEGLGVRGDYEVGEEWGCVWRGEGEVRGEWVFVDDGGGDDDCLYVMSDLWLFLVVSMFADYIYIYT